MLTPLEIRDKTFKNGLGYDKKDVEQFIKELSDDFKQLLNENESLKKKIKDLTDSMSYYKSIEKTLQKALIIAEKTAQDIKDNANQEADAIKLDAKANAKMIESQAIKQSEVLEHKTLNLLKQYDLFKAHYRNLLNAQLELLNSSSFSINTIDFSYKETWSKQPELTKLQSKNNREASPGDENAFEFITIEDEEV